MSTIGERLKAWRKEKGLTLTDIQQKTGLSTGGLSAYERDEKQIGSKTLLALYSEFDIDIAYILTGKRAGELSPEEQELINYYRNTNSTGKSLILSNAQSVSNAMPQEQQSSTSKIG